MRLAPNYLVRGTTKVSGFTLIETLIVTAIAAVLIALAAPSCRIPDDCIDSKRYPLFMARAVLQELIESLQSTQGVKPC